MALSQGDTAGIVVLTVLLFGGLLIVIGWLIKDRQRLIVSLGKRDDTIRHIIDKYQESQVANINAVNALKEVLLELRAIIKYKGKGHSND